MFSYFYQILLKNSFEKVFFFPKFWSHDFAHEIKIHILAAILKRKISWIFLLLDYGCIRCIQV